MKKIMLAVLIQLICVNALAQDSINDSTIWYRIVFTSSEKVLSGYNDGKCCKAITPNNDYSAWFKFIQNSDGTYTIVSRNNQTLCFKSGSVGNELCSTSNTSQYLTKFIIKPCDDEYVISPVSSGQEIVYLNQWEGAEYIKFYNVPDDGSKLRIVPEAGKDIDEVLKSFPKVAGQDKTPEEIMCLIGSCFQYGRGVTENPTESVRWYKKAADLGDARGMLNYGWCLETGTGINMDKEQAVSYYHKAAELGNGTAANNLGNCYKKGIGVEKNLTESFEWYKKAAELGNPAAYGKLGQFYGNDNGYEGVVDRNYEEALKWYKKGAIKGNDFCLYCIGWAYEHGEGVKKNNAEAALYYYLSHKADGNGKKELFNNLGVTSLKTITAGDLWEKDSKQSSIDLTSKPVTGKWEFCFASQNEGDFNAFFDVKANSTFVAKYVMNLTTDNYDVDFIFTISGTYRKTAEGGLKLVFNRQTLRQSMNLDVNNPSMNEAMRNRIKQQLRPGLTSLCNEIKQQLPPLLDQLSNIDLYACNKYCLVLHHQYLSNGDVRNETFIGLPIESIP